jgi:hypothetical protein
MVTKSRTPLPLREKKEEVLFIQSALWLSYNVHFKLKQRGENWSVSALPREDAQEHILCVSNFNNFSL